MSPSESARCRRGGGCCAAALPHASSSGRPSPVSEAPPTPPPRQGRRTNAAGRAKRNRWRARWDWPQWPGISRGPRTPTIRRPRSGCRATAQHGRQPAKSECQRVCHPEVRNRTPCEITPTPTAAAPRAGEPPPRRRTDTGAGSPLPPTGAQKSNTAGRAAGSPRASGASVIPGTPATPRATCRPVSRYHHRRIRRGRQTRQNLPRHVCTSTLPNADSDML